MRVSSGAGSSITTAPPWPHTSLTISWQLSEGKMMERRKKIALELSELVVYCRPVPFDEESEHLLGWWPPQAVTVTLQTLWGAPRSCFRAQHRPGVQTTSLPWSSGWLQRVQIPFPTPLLPGSVSTQSSC